MQEIGLPCSVITSHGEPSQIQAFSNSATTMVLDSVSYNVQGDEVQTVQASGDEVAVFDLVSMKIWPEEEDQIDPSLEATCQPLPRKRKCKRPYSPVIPVSSKKLVNKRKSIKKTKRVNHPEALHHDDSAVGQFSCDRCKSPYVINPAKVHVPNSRRRNYWPRKLIDPVSRKTLLLCNACGLAMSRPKKQKDKKVPPSQENKQKYLEECVSFGAKLAETLQEPDASRLYCPAFKMKPCECLQNYITERDVEESCKRAIFLLSLLKEAKTLSKQKNHLRNSQEVSGELNTTTQMMNKIPVQRGLSKRRSQVFEDFVLTKRHYLRNELGLCERACQRVLMYSNNFLHKHLKSSPDKSPRIQKVSGRNSRGLLKPISELVNETCCGDKCVLLALTHSKLLESWRSSAKLGQREARRVLAEMLTPCGGSKANCYRFISMITGCSHTTICVVNEQLKRTQGDREPPEHGLKEWWRLHNKEKPRQTKSDILPKIANTMDESDPDEFSKINIPTEAELQLLDPREAMKQLELHRQKLMQIKKKLAYKQLQLEQQQQKLQFMQEQPSHQDHKNVTDRTPNVNSQQLLHILEIPSSTSSESTSQPAISVMTASGGFEPLTSISVSLPDGGQTTFSNVVILPDSVLENPVLHQETLPSSSQNVLESESDHTAQSRTPSEFNLVPAVFPGGNKECCDLPRIYYLDS